ncbi:MAG: aminotransferase class III-fold pyridoxal phosphate-dependent enzyme [Polyangiales bacterium]
MLDTLDREGLIEGAVTKGEYLLGKLNGLVAKYPTAATAARGWGLMAGLVLADDVDVRGVLGALRERGVLLSMAGDKVLRFVPALTITEAEIDEGLAALDAVLSDAPRVKP